MPTMRDVSRQEYLRKREEDKLRALADELEDAKYLFEGVKLTAKERAELEYKQRVYDLAMERRAALDKVVDDGYSLPTNYGVCVSVTVAGSNKRGWKGVGRGG